MSLTQHLHPLTALRQGSTPAGKALHKPVLLLALLEEMEIRGALIAINAALKKRFESIWMLLMPDQKPGDFFKPVYHLPNDGFWEVLDRHGRRVAREYGSLKAAAADGATGLFTGELGRFLSAPEGRELARMVLLDQYFPATGRKYYELYGQSPEVPEAEAGVLEEPAPRYQCRLSLREYAGFIRDWKFRTHVLRQYDYTCCMSGWRAEFHYAHPLLDAAHIEPHARSGMNGISNGLALCKNLHAAFDHGLIALSDDYRILVNPALHESPSAYSLRSLAGRRILLPGDTRYYPSKERLRTHRETWGLAHTVPPPTSVSKALKHTLKK